MQVIILVNEKPESCKDCPFYNETLIEMQQSSDILEKNSDALTPGKMMKIEEECFLTHRVDNMQEVCPLVELTSSLSFNAQEEDEDGA